MGTQWRTGMAGPTGLDYTALPIVMKLEGVPKRDRQDVFDCVRIMESAALNLIHSRD